MPYLVEGVLGAAAISLTLGAVQFATGRDLASSAPGLSTRVDNDVNRATKANRAAATAHAQATQTIAFQPHGLAATSVVLRMPARREAREGARKPLLLKSGQPKKSIACEPMVSVLTEVAKQLEPGRCLT
ncbi:MAG: hypothetical protein JO283_18735 [Bradyrhizobium sp.]|nr:hypothetical protein [Bradyrhizobium sp.]